MSLPPTATVVIARTAYGDRQRRARAWLEEIVSLASDATGFVRADIQPPSPQHPDDWVVVYEFETNERLRSWLESSERLAMVSGEPDLFSGAPREQIIATRNLGNSVNAVASFRLRALDEDAPRGLFDAETIEDAFNAEYERFVSVISRFEGFLRCELFAAVPGVQDETVIVFSFEDRRSLDTWLDSDERSEALKRLQPLFETDRVINIVGGFAGWFGQSEGRPVPTWKQATLILFALYPTALAIGYIRSRVLPDVGTPIATLIGNAGGVVVLSWWLMPWLTRRFADWLRR